MPKIFRYIRLTKHALDRMAQRGVTKKSIKETLKNPDTVVSSSEDERYDKRFGSKRLVVRWTLEKNTAVVITVYWQ